MRASTAGSEKPGIKTPLAVWALYVALSLSATMLHAHLVDTEKWREKRQQWAEAILKGQAWAPDQYRILTHWVAGGLRSATGLSVDESYLVIRGASTAASAMLFHRLLAAWFPLGTCVFGVVLLLALYPLTYAGYFFQPADPTNLLFFLLGYLAIRARKDGWFAVVLALAVLNRETALLLLPCWVLARYDELSVRSFLLRAAGLGGLGVGVYSGIRNYFGVLPYYTDHYFFLYSNPKTPVAWAYVACLSVPMVMAWRQPAVGPTPRFLRRAAGMLPFMLAVLWTLMAADEPRIYLPALPIVIGLALSRFVLAREWPPPVPVTLQGWLVRGRRFIYVGLFLGFCGLLGLFVRYMEGTYMRGYEVNRILEASQRVLSTGDQARAIALLQDGLQRFPHEADLHRGLAVVYEATPATAAQAAHHWRAYLELRPRAPEADEIRRRLGPSSEGEKVIR